MQLPSLVIGIARTHIAFLLAVALATSAMAFTPATSHASGTPPPVPDKGAYFGAYAQPKGALSMADAMLALETQVGRKFALDRQYRAWEEAIPSGYDAWTSDQGRIPVVSWKAQRRKDGSLVTWRDIAQGKEDPWIKQQAMTVASFGKPIFISFHHEPEDDPKSGTAADFVAAWRHVHTIFRDLHANNVSWTWIMMVGTFRDPANASAFYPGNEYVDWVAADGYNWFGCAGWSPSWLSFEEVFRSFREFSRSTGKPAMIPEWGTVDDQLMPGRAAQWFRDASTTIKSWPEIKGLAYFNADAECSWRVETSKSTLSAFSEIGQDPYFAPSATATSTRRITPVPPTLPGVGEYGSALGNSVTINHPYWAQPGDYIAATVVFSTNVFGSDSVTSYDALAPKSAPFSLVGGTYHATIWGRRVGSSNPAQYTWKSSSKFGLAYVVLNVFRGVSDPQPINAFAGSSTSTGWCSPILPSPSVSPTVPGAGLLNIIVVHNVQCSGTTPPMIDVLEPLSPPMLELSDYGSGQPVAIETSFQQLSNAGATGERTATIFGTTSRPIGRIGIQLALAPASATP